MATLKEYRNMLRVNKHRLDDELEIHAEMQERISDEVGRLRAQLAEAHENLRRTEARLSDDFREEGTKMTVDAIASRVRRHRDRIAAWEREQQRAQELGQWEGLYEAWKVKGFNMRDLCALYGSQYFALASHQIRHRDERAASDRALEARPLRPPEVIEDAQPRTRARVAL